MGGEIIGFVLCSGGVAGEKSEIQNVIDLRVYAGNLHVRFCEGLRLTGLWRKYCSAVGKPDGNRENKPSHATRKTSVYSTNYRNHEGDNVSINNYCGRTLFSA